jgi:FkbM family methyltransferase
VLISTRQLSHFWKVQPKGILHVGAHEAEERDDYLGAGWCGPFFWVEAQEKKAEELRHKLPVEDVVIHGAAWDAPSQLLTLHITNNSQSSSLFQLGSHKVIYPEISVVRHEAVQTICLDDAIPPNFFPEFIAMDIQGAELKALQGATRILSKAKWVYLEVNKERLYDGCCLVSELDNFLTNYGFNRVQTRWVFGAGWGDALYIHEASRVGFWRSKPLSRLAIRLHNFGALIFGSITSFLSKWVHTWKRLRDKV